MAKDKLDSQKNKMSPLPSKQQIITYLESVPQSLTKREINRAFAIKGDNRLFMKALLKELVEEGHLIKHGAHYTLPHSTPEIAKLEIIGRDRDGQLIGILRESANDTRRLYVHNKSGKGHRHIAGIGDQILAKIFKKNSEDNAFEYHAQVLKILEHQKQTILGIAKRDQNKKWRLIPIYRRNDEILLEPTAEQHTQLKPNMLVEAWLTQEKRFGLSHARIEKILGRLDHEKNLSILAIYGHDIPHIFPEDVCLESQKATLPSVQGREDWQTLPFITIDPVDARDHDDAVYVEKDPSPHNSGGFIIYVAIADVAAIVLPNSALDHEAYRRGNSVYFPDRVVPMLPENISNHLCSLQENEPRAALAVKMVFNAQGQKLTHTFHRAMIRIQLALSYEQAQYAFDGQFDEQTAPWQQNIIAPLWAAYQSLKQMREQRAPLDLDLPEKKIILDTQGHILDILVPPRLEAHRLIEELMIQANVCAAETLKTHKQALIYRVHDRPSLSKASELQNFLKSLNLKLADHAALKPAGLNHILNKVENTDHQHLINQVILRAQSRAEYSPENIGHFGLNLDDYTHFTSPIRRYSDLIIHRALIKILKLGDDGLTPKQEEKLAEIAEHISKQERRAMTAERETVDRLIAHYLANKVGCHFPARICGVTQSGLFITVDHYGADGLVPIKTLQPGYFIFDQHNHALISERHHKGYQLGDYVDVILQDAQPLSGSLRFSMSTPPRPLNFSSHSYHKTQSHKRKFKKIYKRKS